MGRNATAAIATATILASVSAAGVIRHDRDDQAHLDLAAMPDFASVGALYLTDGPLAIGLCSATLIRDDWVLTAGHCTTVIDEASDMVFAVGGEVRRGTHLSLHPSITDPNRPTLDLALFKLDAPISSVAPAPLYDGNDEVGRLATSVGYGRTGDGLTGAIEGTEGVKRAGQNVIENIDPVIPLGPDWIGYDFDHPDDPSANALGDATPVDLEYLIAPGDSGGGTFILDDDGVWKLAGVHSFLASTGGGLTGDYGDTAGLPRVSAVLPWIAATIPAPGSLLALAPLIASRRRR